MITSTVKQRLVQAGITLNDLASPPPPSSPWFVRALQAFSGWLAALFLLGFIATAVVLVLESPLASLVAGGTLIGSAFALLRVTHNDVLEHMALAFSLAGQLLMAWSAIDVWGVTAALWWALLVLQSGLALMMPSQVHRCLSAFSASLALTMALSAIGLAQEAKGVVLLTMTWLWLNECRWHKRIRAVQAWGFGLLISLLVLQVMEYSGLQTELSASNAHWLSFWLADGLSAGLIALALVCVIHQAFRQRTTPMMTQRLMIYAAVALVAVVSGDMPGLGVGIVVLFLGFVIALRVVMASGILMLLVAVSRYYYSLEATLMVKSLLLLAMGILLLSLRWGLTRWLGVTHAP